MAENGTDSGGSDELKQEEEMGDRGDRGEREEARDRPHLGDLRERLEALRRIPVDDAIGLLRVYLMLAFREGEIDGRDDECQCVARLLRAEHCCRRRRRDDDDDWCDEDDEGDRRRRR